MRAAVLRYRVMAYVTGVVLIILCFVGIPLQDRRATPRSPTTSACCTDPLHHLPRLRLAAGPAAAADHRADGADAAGGHHPDPDVRGGALGDPPLHRPGAGRGGPDGRAGDWSTTPPAQSRSAPVTEWASITSPRARRPRTGRAWSRWSSPTCTSNAPRTPGCSPRRGWTRAPGCCWKPSRLRRPAATCSTWAPDTARSRWPWRPGHRARRSGRWTSTSGPWTCARATRPGPGWATCAA